MNLRQFKSIFSHFLLLIESFMRNSASNWSEQKSPEKQNYRVVPEFIQVYANIQIITSNVCCVVLCCVCFSHIKFLYTFVSICNYWCVVLCFAFVKVFSSTNAANNYTFYTFIQKFPLLCHCYSIVLSLFSSLSSSSSSSSSSSLFILGKSLQLVMLN